MARQEHPLTDLDEGTSALVDEVTSRGEPMVLTREGRGVAVLLTMEQYRALDGGRQASLEGAVAEAEADVAAGRWRVHADIAQRLKARAGRGV